MNQTFSRMKQNIKRAGFVALLLGLFTVSFSQEQQTRTESTLQPKIGVKGGINLSNLYVDDVKDENMKVGLNIGAYAKIPVTRGFSIQPELLYSSKGSKITYDNALGTGEYRFNLNYVEVPVLAVFNVAPNFNIHAGGYAAYLASANIKRLDDDGDIDKIADLNEDNFRRFDYGLVGGIGFDVHNFTIGARYNYGLNEIGKSGNASGELTKNAKNSAVNLYVGFGF